MTDAFERVLDEVRELHCQKQKDYGTQGDPYFNVRASQEWGVEPWVGAMIRADDKSRRLKAYVHNHGLANESVHDSLIDRVVYDIIALILWEEASTLFCP